VNLPRDREIGVGSSLKRPREMFMFEISLIFGKTVL